MCANIYMRVHVYLCDLHVHVRVGHYAVIYDNN